MDGVQFRTNQMIKTILDKPYRWHHVKKVKNKKMTAEVVKRVSSILKIMGVPHEVDTYRIMTFK